MYIYLPSHLKPFVKEKKSTCEIGTIYTYTVRPTFDKIRKLCLDDITYANNPELVNLIPRGYSCLVDFNGKEIYHLKGIEKFSGKTPLDDDSEIDSHLIDFGKIKEWESSGKLVVSFREKANGKMCIFSLILYNEKRYIFGGSKNSHRLYCLDETIKENNLTDSIIKRIKEDIEQKKIVPLYGTTILGEFCDGNHIVYTPETYMVYFFPEEISTIKKILADQEYLPTEEQLEKIRNLKKIEGVVIQYTNKQSGELYRQKFKTIWYIIIRVIREKVSKNDINNIKKTIKKRSDDFLHLTDSELEYWYDLSDNFILFMQLRHYHFSSVSYTSGIGMAIRWNEFESGDWKYSPQKEPKVIQNENIQKLKNYTEVLLKNNMKVCLIVRGTTASDKSLIYKDLKDYEIFSTFEEKFDPLQLEEFHQKNYNNFSVSTSKLICVDIVNLSVNRYMKYIKNAQLRGYITLVLNFESQDVNYHMYKKITIKPSYYGIFFDKDALSQFNIIQTKPLHITCSFISKGTIGNEYSVDVLHENRNQAGRCLVVDLCDFPYYDSFMIPHITIETYKGFFPIDVGKNITSGKNTSTLKKNITGVYGPIY